MWLAPLIASAALGYESDTLTDRHLPLPDVTTALDERVQDIVIDAIATVNQQTRCRAEPQTMHHRLAHVIHARLSANELVPARRGIASMGFDRLSAWIEKGGVSRRAFDDRRDIFGSAGLRHSVLLTWAGVCSTVRVNGVLIGTDKLDHFFEEGYHQWRRGEQGVDWATSTENGWFGLKSSGTFSFADLRANADGARFFGDLLSKGGVATLDAAGCLAPATPFTWRDYVTNEYDEVHNPPVYLPLVGEAVSRHLDLNRDAYCADYAVWGGPEHEAQLAATLAARPAYVGDRAPERTDPYRLAERCADWIAPEGPYVSPTGQPPQDGIARQRDGRRDPTGGL